MKDEESQGVVQELMNVLNVKNLTVSERLALSSTFLSTEISCAFLSGEMSEDVEVDDMINEVSDLIKSQVKDSLKHSRLKAAKKSDC